MIRRILIANRGEIARRVIRTCRAMNLGAVAVFSEADRDAPHVREADQAIAIGPANASESYLDIERIVAAARECGADAVHPGYGFLSENPAFVERLEAAGLVFIGPPAAVMRRMGSKTGARALMESAGVPVVPGRTPDAQDDESIVRAAEAVGFPVLLKAASGGGGKGMRTVRTRAEIGEAIGAARREAERAFGNGAMYVERLIERARHVEVQIFADAHGQIVHLFERDCTLQRRHQKVIEEAPAPALDAGVRERLRDAALAAAHAAGYVNAGTVEFLVEGEGASARFYFLEINMRLQVEHPVTEAITGLDLVRAQILVASGAPLPFSQRDVTVDGHAIECRVYAEDPQTLLPQAGRLLRYRIPAGDGVRVDDGVREGQTITVHYDPLIAKIIAKGATREEARRRLIAALDGSEILGLRHNLAFLRALLERPELANVRAHTKFIEEHAGDLVRPPDRGTIRAAAAIAAALATADAAPIAGAAHGAGVAAHDPWDVMGPLTW